MPDREKYIEVLSKAVKKTKEYNEDIPMKISLECVEDILVMLKEQSEIIRCKECKHQHEYKTGSCPHYTTWGSVAPDDWFCADGERR